MLLASGARSCNSKSGTQSFAAQKLRDHSALNCLPRCSPTAPRISWSSTSSTTGNIVSKLPSSSFYKFTGTTFNRYTQVVSKRDVAYARTIRLCPVIFQAYVPKRVELRITVVGQKVFAAEIHSQHSNHTRHDWRRYDRYKTPYFPHDLPRDLQQRCIQLVETARSLLWRHRHGSHARRTLRVPRNQSQRPIPLDRKDDRAADQRRDLRPSDFSDGGINQHRTTRICK